MIFVSGDRLSLLHDKTKIKSTKTLIIQKALSNYYENKFKKVNRQSD